MDAGARAGMALSSGYGTEAVVEDIFGNKYVVYLLLGW